jgi:hypothetical protein
VKGDKAMASYRDPEISFNPIEVVERLLEISEYCGSSPKLFISSSLDLAIYLDSFGFDGYSLSLDSETAFDFDRAMTTVLPSGDKTRNHLLAH